MLSNTHRAYHAVVAFLSRALLDNCLTFSFYLSLLPPSSSMQIHLADFRGKYVADGLDVVEMRAIWHNLPVWGDASGGSNSNHNNSSSVGIAGGGGGGGGSGAEALEVGKAEWRSGFKSRLDNMVYKLHAGNLPEHLKRNPAYADCELQHVFDPTIPLKTRYERSASLKQHAVDSPLDPNELETAQRRQLRPYRVAKGSVQHKTKAYLSNYADGGGGTVRRAAAGDGKAGVGGGQHGEGYYEENDEYLGLEGIGEEDEEGEYEYEVDENGEYIYDDVDGGEYDYGGDEHQQQHQLESGHGHGNAQAAAGGGIAYEYAGVAPNAKSSGGSGGSFSTSQQQQQREKEAKYQRLVKEINAEPLQSGEAQDDDLDSVGGHKQQQRSQQQHNSQGKNSSSTVNSPQRQQQQQQYYINTAHNEEEVVQNHVPHFNGQLQQQRNTNNSSTSGANAGGGNVSSNASARSASDHSAAATGAAHSHFRTAKKGTTAPAVADSSVLSSPNSYQHSSQQQQQNYSYSHSPGVTGSRAQSSRNHSPLPEPQQQVSGPAAHYAAMSGRHSYSGGGGSSSSHMSPSPSVRSRSPVPAAAATSSATTAAASSFRERREVNRGNSAAIGSIIGTGIGSGHYGLSPTPSQRSVSPVPSYASSSRGGMNNNHASSSHQQDQAQQQQQQNYSSNNNSTTNRHSMGQVNVLSPSRNSVPANFTYQQHQQQHQSQHTQHQQPQQPGPFPLAVSPLAQQMSSASAGGGGSVGNRYSSRRLEREQARQRRLDAQTRALNEEDSYYEQQQHQQHLHQQHHAHAYHQQRQQNHYDHDQEYADDIGLEEEDGRSLTSTLSSHGASYIYENGHNSSSNHFVDSHNISAPVVAPVNLLRQGSAPVNRPAATVNTTVAAAVAPVSAREISPGSASHSLTAASRSFLSDRNNHSNNNNNSHTNAASSEASTEREAESSLVTPPPYTAGPNKNNNFAADVGGDGDRRGDFESEGRQQQLKQQRGSGEGGDYSDGEYDDEDGEEEEEDDDLSFNTAEEMRTPMHHNHVPGHHHGHTQGRTGQQHHHTAARGARGESTIKSRAERSERMHAAAAAAEEAAAHAAQAQVPAFDRAAAKDELIHQLLLGDAQRAAALLQDIKKADSSSSSSSLLVLERVQASEIMIQCLRDADTLAQPLPTLQLFVEALKADVNYQESDTGKTLLHHLVSQDKEALGAYLIARGANIFIEDFTTAGAVPQCPLSLSLKSRCDWLLQAFQSSGRQNALIESRNAELIFKFATYLIFAGYAEQASAVVASGALRISGEDASELLKSCQGENFQNMRDPVGTFELLESLGAVFD